MFSKLGWALAAAVSFAGIGAASAADMAVKARPMPVPVYSWTGCYIGISAGAKGVQTRDTVNYPVPAPFVSTSLGLGDLEDITWIGGGQEWAATNNITLGLEGRYSDYGTQRFNAGPVVTTPPAAAAITLISNTYRDVRIETGEIMAKVNYKFGGPVVARY